MFLILDGCAPAEPAAVGMGHEFLVRSCQRVPTTAPVTTLPSIGPMLGSSERKYWFSASGSRENCTPGKNGPTPRRNGRTIAVHRASALIVLASAATCAAASRLVNQVHPEPTAQEHVLIALASVRRGFPGLPELPETVPHHERQLAGVHRHLVEHARMVAVKRLAIRGLAAASKCQGCGLPCRPRRNCPAAEWSVAGVTASGRLRHTAIRLWQQA